MQLKLWIFFSALVWPCVLCEGTLEESQRRFEQLLAGHRSDPRPAWPPLRHARRQCWGEALEHLGLGRGDLSGPRREILSLWGVTDIEGLLEVLRALPMQASQQTADIIFESRLGDTSKQLDYSVKVFPAEFAEFAQHERVRSLAAESWQWSLIRDFAEAATASRLQAHHELWLEIDEAAGPSKPSVFLGPTIWMRDILMAEPISELLAVERLDAASSWDAAEILEPLFREVWSPFWSSMPWLDRAQIAVRRQLTNLILGFGDSISLYQLGFWLARDTGMVRVVLEAERIYDEPQLYGDAAAWWAATRADLERLGWRWEDREHPSLLEDVMPQLMTGISHFFCALDVGESGVASKVGFELYFSQEILEQAIQEHGAGQVPRQHVHAGLTLDALARLGLCTPAQKVILLAHGLQDGERQPTKWHEEVSYGSLRYHMLAQVNHIKVIFEPGRPVEAKLYTVMKWKWLNPMEEPHSEEL